MPQTRQQRRAQQRKSDRKTSPPPRRRIRWAWIIGAFVVVALVGVVTAVSRDDRSNVQASGSESEQDPTGLPDSPDYHSLIVAPDDPDHVFLGTHEGLFETTDGGANWRQTDAISGDAMNLARDAADTKTLYAAGHQLFQTSSDGGTTWTDIPLDDTIARELTQGGKAVDIHGFAADPTDPGTVYAAVAGLGLFRSTDAAANFTKLSDTGAAGFGIAVAPTKPRRIYLADAQQGLLLSTDDAKTWTPLQAQIAGVAISSDDPQRVIAAGDALYLATDGRSFRKVQETSEGGFGPLAISPSDPKVAYAIALPGTLYASRDGGATWKEQ